MNQFLEYIAKNAVKILGTYILIIVIIFGCLYVYSIKKDISYLTNSIDAAFLAQQVSHKESSSLTNKSLLLIIEQLEEIAQKQQFIVDQNRTNVSKTTTIIKEEKIVKPTYDEIKDHTVYIVGCSDKILPNDKKIKFMLGDEEKGKCWAGTGTIVKETDTDTYILTNTHVTGKDESNVTLYVKDDETKVVADIIKQHESVDMAVIHVGRKLEGKTPITKISSVAIQDPIYIVGHPLGIKYIYTEGVMSGYTDVSLLIQAPCIFGNSGSGIYNAKGELVGLVYALQMYRGIFGLPMAQITHTLAVDSISIKPFLTELGLYNEKE